LFYLTVAKGYRSGDISPPIVTCNDALTVVPADTLWSYEVGAKTDLLDGRLHLEPSVFHIEWYNDQPDAYWNDGCTISAVRSAAASNGFDLAAQALLSDRLKVGLAVAYTDAHYTDTVKADDEVLVHNGDALGLPPQVPSPWNVTASIEYRFPLSHGVTAELRAQDNFRGSNPGPFPGSRSVSQPNPSTNVLNLRANVLWPSFGLGLFADNVLDSQPTLGRTTGCPWCTVPYAITLRPRTVGVTANWRF
jgi:hypothetical protein